MHVKSATFSTDNSRTARLSIFYRISNHKNFFPKYISITLLQMWLKLHEHRGGYCRKKLHQTVLEEQFPVPRNHAASKIGNRVISLLCRLRCHCHPDHNKFSSLSNTTVVSIFPRSNVGGIDLEKLYRATLRMPFYLACVVARP